ncbi:unnamed protein product [Triticum turgidum subsp. durum]|uniref:C3H1-type domain-containing protein n=1 Tax=Triticum turgidum subsp. durum TaxID=4567 RepID=A0A9R0VLI1_TRITD|nr:unnamed protein product [Triticum turgidum subsp. durum]
MGSHSTIGQSDAFYSPNTMVKRPRLESSLPIYPQRPGEKECAFYMRTRTCKYEETCKFDHPQWVPEGGIPNWKEVIIFHFFRSIYSMSICSKLFLKMYMLFPKSQLYCH